MKKLLFVFFTLSSLQLMAQPWKSIKGDGNLKKESREIGNFTSISSYGPLDVQISYGTSSNLEVEADENLLPYIETKVENGKLTIGSKQHVNLKSRSKMVVYVSMTSINALDQHGSGNITGSGKFGNNGKTDINVSGSGNIKLDFDSFGSVSLSVSGSGNIKLKGNTVNNITATVSGSGNIDCINVKCDDADAKISGSGNIKVDVQKSIIASVSGSGNVFYKGDATNVVSKIAGSGKVVKI